MNRGLGLWLLLVLVAAAGLYHALVQMNKRPGEDIDRTSRSAGPAGAKAAYVYLRELGVRTDRLDGSWDADLPEQGLLVVVEPIRRPSAEELTALQDWVSAGGSLLLAGSVPWEIWPLGGRHAYGSLSPKQIPILVPSALTAEIDALRLTAVWRLIGPYQTEEGNGQKVIELAGDRLGTAVLLVQYGEGRVILAADPGFLSNARLKEAPANALFLWRAAEIFGRGRVYFDDFHLKRVSPAISLPGVSGNLPTVVLVIWWQIIILCGLLFYSLSRRFGRPLILPETGGRTITEYIKSLAALYQRAQATDAALAGLYHGLIERMRLLTDLSPEVDPETLATAAAHRLGRDAGELRELIKRCRFVLASDQDDPKRRRISAQELVDLAGRLDSYRKEIEKWVTPPR